MAAGGRKSTTIQIGTENQENTISHVQHVRKWTVPAFLLDLVAPSRKGSSWSTTTGPNTLANNLLPPPLRHTILHVGPLLE